MRLPWGGVVLGYSGSYTLGATVAANLPRNLDLTLTGVGSFLSIFQVIDNVLYLAMDNTRPVVFSSNTQNLKLGTTAYPEIDSARIAGSWTNHDCSDRGGGLGHYWKAFYTFTASTSTTGSWSSSTEQYGPADSTCSGAHTTSANGNGTYTLQGYVTDTLRKLDLYIAAGTAEWTPTATMYTVIAVEASSTMFMGNGNIDVNLRPTQTMGGATSGWFAK